MENHSGKVFLNRFRVDELLTSGESFSRYRGYDLKRSLPLAIRVFDFSIPADETVLCFQQRNLTLQTVQHPNVIPFYGLYDDQGKSFVIEKSIEGPVLGQILRQRGGKPMLPEEALIYLKALATALEYMHGFGLVHSTIDPINIQVARDGSVMLGNFGFARFIDKPMSKTGVFGLPLFQAPEQLRGERVYPNTDIYALGILFFEFVTGRHPFLGAPSSTAAADQATVERLRNAHLQQPPPDLNQFNPALPSGLTQTVLTALAKDPKQRYQSAQEMLEMCSAVLGSSPSQVPNRIGGRDAPPPTQVVGAGGTSSTTPNVPYIPVAATAAAQVGDMPARTGTQVIPEPPRQVVQTGYAPPPPPPSSVYLPEEEKSKRPAWLLPIIALLVLAVLLCGAAGVWASLPILQELFGSPTSTPTLTATQTEIPTATLPPPTEPPLVPTLAPSATLPIVLPPTEPPPPPTLVPTEPPPPSPTAQQTAFKVTIRNNESYPIYAFRDGTLMGSDPIPPGRFIWYLNIPAGQHYFRFCLDASGTQCPTEKQVMVDQDITISVP